MNYLAHIYLSFDQEFITLGNVIADFVKGNKYNEYPEEIKKGILIHREIDAYTDKHPIFIQGKRRLSHYRHFSGVIMDMYYDHFLAKNWSSYSEETLSDFTQKNYKIFLKHDDKIPRNASYLIHYMQKDDWLYNYQFMEGLQRSLTGMSRRFPFLDGIEKATTELKGDYESFEGEFHDFFRDITSHIHNFTDQLNHR